jgi:rhodanese-related sulfurtransferase
MTITRRKILLSVGAWTATVDRAYADKVLTASDAFVKAATGKVMLIDIRTPEEWAETGSGTGAKRLDMRRDDFVSALDTLIGGDRSKPLALICARGVRSGQLSRVLRKLGYSNVIDVPEGMLGSYAGPGWLARGLPVNQ